MLYFLAYVTLIENDSNSEVRRAVLSCIAPSAKTLPKIVGRTKDIKDAVRKLAYQVISSVSFSVFCRHVFERWTILWYFGKTLVTDFSSLGLLKNIGNLEYSYNKYINRQFKNWVNLQKSALFISKTSLKYIEINGHHLHF